ncbi:MAG: NAD-binding protein [Burkholderiales bacterium]
MRILLAILVDSPHFRRLLATLGVFAAIHLVGTVGYLRIGPPGTTWVDGLYMTFITVATIGYGEVVDLRDETLGRFFTMGLALAGIATMTFLFSTVTAFLLETNLNHAYRRRRMQAEIDALSDHFIVCGAGRIGAYVIDELRTDHRAFVVVELDAAALEARLDADPRLLAIAGDAGDDDVLARAGIARASGVFAVTGDDSKNLVISLSAKQLNPRVRVVARVHDPRNAAKTRRAGADEIVSPDFTGGHRIASLMIRPQMVSLVDELLRAGERLAVEEIVVPPRPAALRVASLGRSVEWLLVAVRDGASWTFNPPEGTEVTPGQALVVIASAQGRRELEARVSA